MSATRIVIEQQGPATLVTIGDRTVRGHSADALVRDLAPDLVRILLDRWARRGPGCVRLTLECSEPVRPYAHSETLRTHTDAPNVRTVAKTPNGEAR